MKDEMEKENPEITTKPDFTVTKPENQLEGDLGVEIQKLIQRLKDHEVLEKPEKF